MEPNIAVSEYQVTPPDACLWGEEPEAVLLVEDQALVREVTREVLRRAGYRVIAVAGAAEAYQTVGNGETRFALLITDMVLPDALGSHLALELTRVLPELKVILTSGYPRAASDEVGNGGAWFLPKPYSADILIETVRRILQARGRTSAG